MPPGNNAYLTYSYTLPTFCYLRNDAMNTVNLKNVVFFSLNGLKFKQSRFSVKCSSGEKCMEKKSYHFYTGKNVVIFYGGTVKLLGKKRIAHNIMPAGHFIMYEFGGTRSI